MSKLHPPTGVGALWLGGGKLAPTPVGGYDDDRGPMSNLRGFVCGRTLNSRFHEPRGLMVREQIQTEQKTHFGWVDFAQSWLVRTAHLHRCTSVAPPLEIHAIMREPRRVLVVGGGLDLRTSRLTAGKKAQIQFPRRAIRFSQRATLFSRNAGVSASRGGIELARVS